MEPSAEVPAWAEAEFGVAELVVRPAASLPAQCGAWAEPQAAYRPLASAPEPACRYPIR